MKLDKEYYLNKELKRCTKLRKTSIAIKTNENADEWENVTNNLIQTYNEYGDVVMHVLRYLELVKGNKNKVFGKHIIKTIIESDDSDLVLICKKV